MLTIPTNPRELARCLPSPFQDPVARVVDEAGRRLGEVLQKAAVYCNPDLRLMVEVPDTVDELLALSVPIADPPPAPTPVIRQAVRVEALAPVGPHTTPRPPRPRRPSAAPAAGRADDRPRPRPRRAEPNPIASMQWPERFQHWLQWSDCMVASAGCTVASVVAILAGLQVILPPREEVDVVMLVVLLAWQRCSRPTGETM